MSSTIRPVVNWRQRTASPSSQSPDRDGSISSGSSSSSKITALSVAKRSSEPRQTTAAAQTVFAIPARPNNARNAADLPLRQQSPSLASVEFQRARSRQHSQGFFEPSLPTASLSASQIAAQAAMHVLSAKTTQHFRKPSSSTISDAPISSRHTIQLNRKPSGLIPIQVIPAPSSYTTTTYHSRNSSASGTHLAAASAANAAFPRSPLSTSSSLPQRDHAPSPVPSESLQKPAKEKSRMKLFSRASNIGSSKDRDGEKKVQTSPNKLGVYPSGTLPRMGTQSTVSLADSIASGTSSIYSSTNGSTSTLVPTEKPESQEKEKHRHNFLSRQKHKLNSNDHHTLALSSASSNSKPADPSAPQSLYSFAPSSPAIVSTFNKSRSGLDLRHGGRALRERKREEKAAAAAGFVSPLPSFTGSVFESSLRDRDYLGAVHSDRQGGSGTTGVPGNFGPASSMSTYSQGQEFGMPSQSLAGLRLPGMTADDAWPYLKARLLSIFEGEDIRTPIEDFNKLVVAHLQRCMQRRIAGVIVEDLRELLHTGFYSLDQTLRHVPEDRILLNLAETWSFVFGTILPFLQAVFLPLDLEFKMRNASLSAKDVSDFWLPPNNRPGATLSPNLPSAKPSISARALDVRVMTLASFRDTVMLPRYDTLLSIFSRLSLDAVTSNVGDPGPVLSQRTQRSNTAASTLPLMDHSTASYTSQGTTTLESTTTSSIGARSRATSNTSAGSFHSTPAQRWVNTLPAPQSWRDHVSPPSPFDSTRVTEMVARMLQCVSVLASLPGTRLPIADSPKYSTEDVDSDAPRKKMEVLAKALKLNWMGRSRTGRNRRGFIGSKARTPIGLSVGVNA